MHLNAKSTYNIHPVAPCARRLTLGKINCSGCGGCSTRRGRCCLPSVATAPLNCSSHANEMQFFAKDDTIQAVAMDAVVKQSQLQQHASPHAAMANYLAAGRNWRAVEDFYIDLVAGRVCLAHLGLAPAGLPAAAAASCPKPAGTATVYTEQQQQQCPSAASAANASTEDTATLQQPELSDTQKQQQQLQRRTYKVHVSYLGSSFTGWMRQPGKQTVEGTLAAAVAAAGLADTPPEFNSSKAKRKAAKAERRAKQQAISRIGVEGTAVQKAGAAGACEVAASNDVRQPPIQQQQQQGVLPLVNCGGRTDAGVTAVGQVISFYSWQPALQPQQLLCCINTALQALLPAQHPLQQADLHSTAAASCSTGGTVPPAASQVRAWQAAEVGREFHATFSATWRRYVYLLPLRQQQHGQAAEPMTSDQSQQQLLLPRFTDELNAALQLQHKQSNPPSPPPTIHQQLLQQQQQQQEQEQDCSIAQLQQRQQSEVQRQALPDADVNPATVHALLQQLQGKKLNYYVYARDTPKGKDCECTLHVARAKLVHLPAATDDQPHRAPQQQQQQQCTSAGKLVVGATSQDAILQQEQHGVPCLCIELVGDRFLRRMVRVLVATAVRQALLADATNDAIAVHHLQAGAEQAAHTSAAAMPPDGCVAAAAEPLIAVMPSMDRQATAPPAPALGLCFAAVGYQHDD